MGWDRPGGGAGGEKWRRMVGKAEEKRPTSLQQPRHAVGSWRDWQRFPPATSTGAVIALILDPAAVTATLHLQRPRHSVGRWHDRQPSPNSSPPLNVDILPYLRCSAPSCYSGHVILWDDGTIGSIPRPNSNSALTTLLLDPPALTAECQLAAATSYCGTMARSATFSKLFTTAQC